MTDRNKLKPRRSYTANSVPLTTDLETHEIAINWTDSKLFTKNGAGQIISVTLGGSGGGGSGSGSSSLVYAATPSAFPATGSADNLFIATESQRIYRWATNVYVECGPVGGGAQSLQVTIPGSGDQYWADTLLLLNGNGNLTDSSPVGRSVTAGGSAAATGAAKFGSASIAFTGDVDRLVVDSADFYFLPSLSNSFTIEAWLYPTSFSTYMWIFGHGTTGALNTPAVNIYTSVTTGVVTAFIIGASGDVYFALNSPSGLTLNTWQHLALCYNLADDTARLYINGTSVASQARPSGGTWTASTAGTRIGNFWQSGGNGNYGWVGNIDDVRVTKAARYVGSSFTVPTSTYVTGAYTAPVTIPCLPAT